MLPEPNPFPSFASNNRTGTSHEKRTLRLLLALFIATIPLAKAGDLTGSFADKGVALTSTKEESVGPVSLHALTHLQFDTFLGRANYGGSDQATFRIWPNRLQIKFFDSEESTQAEVYWKTEVYEAAEGQGIMARIQSPDHRDNSYFLQFETVENGEVLQVEATTFGPKLHDLGTYFFPRA